jgi:TnpA family transposase
LERVFLLDDEDRALIDRRRGDHMKLGFGLQLVTVRWIGAFLEDALDVPVAVLDFVSQQLGVADPSQVKRYTERAKTKLDHQWEIRRVYGLKEFAAVDAELRA